MLAGAGLAAALKKRQDKEAVAETLANSGQAASDIVEETVNANKSSQTTEPPVQLPALKPSGGGDEKTFEIEEKYFKFDGKKIDTKKKNKFKLGADLTPVVNTSKPVVTPEATEQVEEQKPPEFIPNLPPQEPLPEPLPEPMPEPIQEPTPEEKPKPRFAAFELKEEIVEEVIEETLTLPAFRSG